MSTSRSEARANPLAHRVHAAADAYFLSASLRSRTANELSFARIGLGALFASTGTPAVGHGIIEDHGSRTQLVPTTRRPEVGACLRVVLPVEQCDRGVPARPELRAP